MTDKELRRLRRVELLGILIDQKKELDDLRRKLADAEKQLARNDVLIQRLIATSPTPVGKLSELSDEIPETPAPAGEPQAEAPAAPETSAVPEAPAAPEASAMSEAPARRYIPEPDADDDEFIPLHVDEARRLADSQSWTQDAADDEALNAAADAAAEAEVPTVPDDTDTPKTQD